MKYQNKGLGYINAIRLSELIQADIEDGIYDIFEVLKSRLEYISHKLVKIHYMSNCELSDSELKTLCENEYIIQY